VCLNIENAGPEPISGPSETRINTAWKSLSNKSGPENSPDSQKPRGQQAYFNKFLEEL